jgi:hypothetical protein
MEKLIIGPFVYNHLWEVIQKKAREELSKPENEASAFDIVEWTAELVEDELNDKIRDIKRRLTEQLRVEFQKSRFKIIEDPSHMPFYDDGTEPKYLVIDTWAHVTQSNVRGYFHERVQAEKYAATLNEYASKE